MVIPYPGAALNEIGLLPWLVAGIFFINGLNTTTGQLKLGKGYKTAMSLTIVINLVLAPIIGWLSYLFLPIGPDLKLGLVIMCIVPTTLSSCIVLTRITGGNAQWALFFTLTLSFLGIFTTPITVGTILGYEIENQSLDLFKKLIQIVLLPFLLGFFCRNRMKIEKLPSYLVQLPTLLVIAGAWLTLSSSQQDLINISSLNLLIVIGLSAVIHIILLLFSWYGATTIGLAAENRLAVLFTASQKTMPIAVSVIVSIDSTLGVAVVSCIIYHFIQMIFDSVLASVLNSNRKNLNAVKL